MAHGCKWQAKDQEEAEGGDWGKAGYLFQVSLAQAGQKMHPVVTSAWPAHLEMKAMHQTLAGQLHPSLHTSGSTFPLAGSMGELLGPALSPPSLLHGVEGGRKGRGQGGSWRGGQSNRTGDVAGRV